MNVILRCTLIIGSLFTLMYMFRQIRHSSMKIEYSVFWAIFSVALSILAIFPHILFWVAALFHFEGSMNALYIIIIFILIMKMFSMTVQLSKQEQQMQRMAQHIALHEAKENKKQ